MIPDIALMIVVYGAARLIVATLDPYRRTAGGTPAQVASALSWLVTAGAIIGLVVLGLLVLSSSASLSGITGQ